MSGGNNFNQHSHECKHTGAKAAEVFEIFVLEEKYCWSNTPTRDLLRTTRHSLYHLSCKMAGWLRTYQPLPESGEVLEDKN